MKFAYADPPYIGQAQKHYGCEEIDHAALIERLSRWYPDGWALSCSTPSLQLLLSLCPPDVRIGAWVKPFCSWKPNVNPAFAWEPIIFRGGRKHERYDDTVRDWYESPVVMENITLKKGLAGAKPKAVCHWILDMLNFQPGDEMHDLYPGTGVMGVVVADRRMAAPSQSGLFSEVNA